MAETVKMTDANGGVANVPKDAVGVWEKAGWTRAKTAKKAKATFKTEPKP